MCVFKNNKKPKNIATIQPRALKQRKITAETFLGIIRLEIMRYYITVKSKS